MFSFHMYKYVSFVFKEQPKLLFLFESLKSMTYAITTAFCYYLWFYRVSFTTTNLQPLQAVFCLSATYMRVAFIYCFVGLVCKSVNFMFIKVYKFCYSFILQLLRYLVSFIIFSEELSIKVLSNRIGIKAVLLFLLFKLSIQAKQ